MSLRKMFAGLCLLLSVLCILSAVNLFAQAQNEDKESDDESTAQPTVTTTITTTQPGPAITPGTGAAYVVPYVPGEQRRVQARSKGQNVQANVRKAQEEMQKAMQKAEEEMQKANMQFDKMLKDLEKGGDRAVMQKAREEIQKAMQKGHDEMQKAKDQYDRTIKEFYSPQPLPPFSVGNIDPFGSGGGYGFNSGKIVMDDRTGQMIIKGPNSVEIITGPEANELREKEGKVVSEIEDVGNQYRSNKDKGERAKLKTKLAELVGQQFAIRQEFRGKQIERLEKELARVRESVQKRGENREQIIKRRIAQLLNEEDDMEF
jgi:hypothetical protein